MRKLRKFALPSTPRNLPPLYKSYRLVWAECPLSATCWVVHAMSTKQQSLRCSSLGCTGKIVEHISEQNKSRSIYWLSPCAAVNVVEFAWWNRGAKSAVRVVRHGNAFHVAHFHVACWRGLSAVQVNQALRVPVLSKNIKISLWTRQRQPVSRYQNASFLTFIPSSRSALDIFLFSSSIENWGDIWEDFQRAFRIHNDKSMI